MYLELGVTEGVGVSEGRNEVWVNEPRTMWPSCSAAPGGSPHQSARMPPCLSGMFPES